MVKKAKEQTRACGLRIPITLFNDIEALAESREADLTSLIVLALIEWRDKQMEQICQNCHTVCRPYDNYCYECGYPLAEDRLKEFKATLDFAAKNPAVAMQILSRRS